MTQEEEILLKIVGQERLEALNKELAVERGLLKDAAQGLREMTITEQQFDAAVAASLPKMVNLTNDVNLLNKEAKQFGGQGGLQLSYVMDDLANTSGNWERHLMSISNNMPGLLMSLGMGAGLAGQLSMVYTGMIALLPVAKKFWETMTGDLPEEARKNLENIKKAAEEAAERFNKLVEHPTSEEEESQKAIATALKGPQGRQIQDALIKAMEASGSGEPPGIQMDKDVSAAERMAFKLANWRDMQVKDIPEIERAQIEQTAAERVKAGNLARAQSMLGQAADGKTRADREAGLMGIQGLVKAQPGFFPENFRKELPHLTQKGIAADEAEADAWEEQSNEWARQGKAGRERRAREKKDKAEEKRQAHQIAQAEAHDRASLEKTENDQRERAFKETDRAVQLRQRRGPQDDYAAEMTRFNRRTGSGLNDDQIQSAAAEAVRMVRQGADVNDAMMGAFQNQIQQMQQLQQRLQMQAARARGLMMGSDQSGQFSQLSPMPGY